MLLIAWIVISEVNKGSDTQSILLTVAYVLCIFICVIMHEFGHALTARRYGIKTRKVTLLPIGGMASMERMPEKPKQELLVAIAGPAVNVVIAIFLTLVGSFTFGDLFSLEKIKTLQSITFDNFLYALCFINVVLVVFNAIPAFPMDGGRVLRALLSYKLERSKATDIAAKLGQIIGIVFIFLGFAGNILLIFIGLFVMAGAYGENTMVKQMEALKGYKIKDAMMTSFSILKPDDSIEKAVDKLLEGSENHFVVAEDDNIKGVLTKENLVKGFQKDKGQNISKIISGDVKSFKADSKLTEAFVKIQRDKNKQRLFPVLENDKLVGVLDLENLQEFIMTRSEMDN